jgi:hypothetical protein
MLQQKHSNKWTGPILPASEMQSAYAREVQSTDGLIVVLLLLAEARK